MSGWRAERGPERRRRRKLAIRPATLCGSLADEFGDSLQYIIGEEAWTPTEEPRHEEELLDAGDDEGVKDLRGDSMRSWPPSGAVRSDLVRPIDDLDRVIQPDNYTAPIDLSDVVLKQVKQIDRGRIDISLGVRVGLSGITAAGSGEKRDPKMVAFQQVLDRLNDLFGSEDFTESQKVSFLEAMLRTLLEDDSLVQQAKVNSAKQFVESPDFDDAVTGAVADNQGAHEKMSDYFFTNAPGRSHLISDIAKWFYQVVSSEHANT